jgi:hypothetical protein
MVAPLPRSAIVDRGFPPACFGEALRARSLERGTLLQETGMRTLSTITWITLSLTAGHADPPKEDRKEPDKVIEITMKDGKLLFLERGQDKARPVTVVVGQTVRWSNRDHKPHTIDPTLVVDGKPLFQIGEIQPGRYKDLTLDIDLYRRAGGRPASVVTIKYQCDRKPTPVGELQLLSAAKRGLGRP